MGGNPKGGATPTDEFSVTPSDGRISVWLTTVVKPFWPAILLEPRYVPQVVNDLHQAGLIVR